MPLKGENIVKEFQKTYTGLMIFWFNIVTEFPCLLGLTVSSCRQQEGWGQTADNSGESDLAGYLEET